MGKAYSEDLRERVGAYVISGHSCRAAAQLFDISVSTAVRIASQYRELGTVRVKPQGRPAGRHGKLAPHIDFLIEIVRAEPDITLSELNTALEDTHGVSVRLSSIHRALKRAGFSYKKRSYRSGTRPTNPAPGA